MFFKQCSYDQEWLRGNIASPFLGARLSHWLITAVALVAFAGSCLQALAAVTVTSQEIALKDQWVQRNLLSPINLPPFSFASGGESSTILLPLWNRVRTDTILDTNRTQHVLTWTNNGLEVKCIAVEYSNYPVVEWTVYLKNVGSSNSSILQDIKGLNSGFHRTNGPEFILNGNKGDFTTEDSYEPYRIALLPNTVKTCAPFYYSGKSSDGPDGWPYYNLQIPDGGVILAIGWPGQGAV